MRNFFLVLLFIPVVFFGQINFDKAPEDFQLFPRNNNNNATVIFSGNFKEVIEFKELKLKVFKDDLLVSEKTLEIINKKFEISSIIEAGLFQYRFELHSKKGDNESLLYKANNIVCGDAYIITGQSNSHASSKKSTYSSSFARSFGVKTGYETYSEEDKMVRWGLATGNCKNCKGKSWEAGYVGGWFEKVSHGVGVWGMELSKLLIEKYQIPVCIINGGSGSSTIQENMLFPEKISLETSFGRLAYRVDQAELKNNIKAIFYHQGESDTYSGLSFYKGRKRGEYTGYAENFEILNSDWQRVYKGLKKIYLFQIHPGCGGDFQSEIREIQNQISKKYNNVEIMSTTSVIGHDGCHFSYKGYKEFAKRILPLVSRDLFEEKNSAIITPPKLMSVHYSRKKEITLTFDQPIEIEDYYELKGTKHLMKNQFFFSRALEKTSIHGVINSLEAKNDQIIISLNTDQKYSSVSYTPNMYYLNTKDIYNGPWIKGLTNQIGALTFHNIKINNSINP